MKTKIPFTIISNDSTNGDGGFGVGVIDLNNVTPIIIDCQQQQAYIDVEALHGRSKIEKKVRFLSDKAHASNDFNKYWIVWVAMQVSEQGPYFFGITASEIRVSKEERRIKLGFKSLPEQVNFLDKALKGKYIFSHMDAPSKKLLKQFLREVNIDYFENSSSELKELLGVE
ncbi:hypothetical protein PB01_10550 [Psychrobacillus glaciei]|uniref:YwhD family protein n=1 Tax=Psychrobacillus glaciei TaxID=2283160 RepID=A0A5J6SMR1_9BACI|nr:YwhD family protein [Psychrobacillus glaciei]QFF99235.1 hypothetical protein PB01_10550 [Psychrobacillus glaciei]